MPDISMCKNDLCTQKQDCYRYRAIPNPFGQYYSSFEQTNKECKDWLDLKFYPTHMYLRK